MHSKRTPGRPPNLRKRFAAIQNDFRARLTALKRDESEALTKLIPTDTDHLFFPDFDAFDYYATILRAIGVLTPHQQMLIRMRFFEDKALNEIAADLNVTAPSIRISIENALRTLRKPDNSQQLEGFLPDLSPHWRTRMENIDTQLTSPSYKPLLPARENRLPSAQQRVDAIIAATDYAGKTFLGTVHLHPTPDSIAQHIGQGRMVIHRLANLSRIPTQGELAQIEYDAHGQARVSTISPPSKP